AHPPISNASSIAQTTSGPEKRCVFSPAAQSLARTAGLPSAPPHKSHEPPPACHQNATPNHISHKSAIDSYLQTAVGTSNISTVAVQVAFSFESSSPRSR